MHADFIHLRVHSAYSLSEGAIKADKIAPLAQAANMPAVAITDTGNLFGALEFSQSAKAKGIQPIIGLQLALTRADSGRPSSRVEGLSAPSDPIVLLAQPCSGRGTPRRSGRAGQRPRGGDPRRAGGRWGLGCRR